ncbi:prepilin peptidase [Patescibacteria group bacterium]|nr:prepilin peptidase [Patescibacteria group bacterium]MBU1703543.1 prepilin peptidase [Patescibacteria group bacterium]MBU1953881.1 prepilin peptidase [Patescibacteria group bacterium]
MAYSLVLLLLFFLGASIGSFLSVAIYRIRNNKPGIFFGNSYCTSCKKHLNVKDLIPIISYLVTKGQCRHCKKAISPYYLFLEITTGLVFIALFLKFPFLQFIPPDNFIFTAAWFIPFLLYAIYSSFFIGIFFYDLQTKRIPDIFLFSLLPISIIGSLILGSPQIWNMFVAGLIALIFFGGQIAVSKGKWLGEGDLYFSFSLAAIFGWQLLLVCITASYFIGALISIPLLLFANIKKDTPIPFAPFLIIGAFATIFFGNDLLSWYMDSITI